MINNKLSMISKQRPWLGYFFIFTLGFIIFLYILIPPGIVGPDSFYHTKMALLIKENGLIQDFPWTQFTTYKDLFVDHHFVYHYLLVPFLNIPSPENLDVLSQEIEPLIKAKLGSAFFAALVFVMLYWFLRRFKIKWALLWTLLAFFLAPLILRLSLIRAPAISLIIFILGFYFIIKKKYILLFILSFIYVWTYGAWPLILITVIIYCLANAVKELINKWPRIQIFKTSFNKTNLKLVLSCASGLTAGLIINPYFPKTLPFYWFQTVKIAMVNYGAKIGVGAEWYPFDPSLLIFSVLPLLIFWLIAIAWFITKIKKQTTSAWFFALLSIFFLLYTYKARRNIEYFIPPALFFSAFMFNSIKEYINWTNVKNQFFKAMKSAENILYFIIIIFTAFITIFFSVSYINTSVYQLRLRYKNEAYPLTYLQKSSHWLKNNTEKGEIVFQSNWDIFPQLFYFNTYNYYINGLDQTFMYEYSNELYDEWLKIVSGKTDTNKVAEIISQKFKSNYIMVTKDNKPFISLLKRSPSLIKTYEDAKAIIYKITY